MPNGRRALKETTERISRERFIRLGAALGMSIAGASVLAACGEESSEQPANQTAESNKSAAKAAGGKAAAGSQEIAQISKVPAGSAVNFMDSSSPAVCTHEGCSVVYKRGELVCPCHGSVFDPSKGGRVLNGPAPTPLPRIPIKVQRGGVYCA